MNIMTTKRKNNSAVNMINEVSSSNLNADIKDQIIGQVIDSSNSGGDDGMLDKIFGKRHPDLYIALMIGVFILIIGCVCSWFFRSDVETVKELWKIFIPALTLVVGYVLGNKRQ